ncbi:interferon beta [Carlito syrichta]|uniref:Interferon beta n=1 Tax=Carlito syrichta TaxID=1868482 RepID=A0A1U7TUJ7_CARSF|nr:interferon beta [Carlito syrichta]CAB0000113.1 TPA: interferon 1DA1 [Carlito syrichta]
MTNRCLLQVALLLCFSMTALSMSDDLLQFRLRSSSLECQNLLWQLNASLEDCLKNRMNFGIPEEIKQPQQFQNMDTTLVIYKMLQKIFDIFTRDFSSTGWNETIVENFLANVYQQIDRLETIVGEKLKKKDIPTGYTVRLMRLNSYYFRIVGYLKAKEYSSCAWTIVRQELLKNFFFINRLSDYLQI